MPFFWPERSQISVKSENIKNPLPDNFLYSPGLLIYPKNWASWAKNFSGKTHFHLVVTDTFHFKSLYCSEFFTEAEFCFDGTDFANRERTVVAHWG